MTGMSKKRIAQFALWGVLLCTVAVLLWQALIPKRTEPVPQTNILWKKASDSIDLYQRLEKNIRQIEPLKAQTASVPEIGTADPTANTVGTPEQNGELVSQAAIEQEVPESPSQESVNPVAGQPQQEEDASPVGGTYAGVFETTFYCGENYPHICGTSNGITANGSTAAEGITVAADTDVLPMGTRIYIEGIGERVVQDRGEAIQGKRVDVFVQYHHDALENGIRKCKVWILNRT